MPENPPSREKPLFLAPLSKSRDYVDKPELSVDRHEPECIGPAIVDGYAEVAAFQHTQRHVADVLAQRQARVWIATEDRIRDAERRARQAHRDLSSEFRLMRDMLARARAGGRDDPPKLLNRLERLEADLDGLPLKDAA